MSTLIGDWDVSKVNWASLASCLKNGSNPDTYYSTGPSGTDLATWPFYFGPANTSTFSGYMTYTPAGDPNHNGASTTYDANSGYLRPSVYPEHGSVPGDGQAGGIATDWDPGPFTYDRPLTWEIWMQWPTNATFLSNAISSNGWIAWDTNPSDTPRFYIRTSDAGGVNNLEVMSQSVLGPEGFSKIEHSFVSGEDYLITITLVSGNVSFYINGVKQTDYITNLATVDNFYPSGEPFGLSSNDLGYYNWTNTYATVMYEGELTEDEIKHNYNLGKDYGGVRAYDNGDGSLRVVGPPLPKPKTYVKYAGKKPKTNATDASSRTSHQIRTKSRFLRLLIDKYFIRRISGLI